MCGQCEVSTIQFRQCGASLTRFKIDTGDGQIREKIQIQIQTQAYIPTKRYAERERDRETETETERDRVRAGNIN